MNATPGMPREYLALAAERAAADCAPHKQPEEFGYEFASWVSPYTKGANRMGGLAFVLQDWASEEGLSEFNPDIQLHGRTPKLLTNTRLEQLLNRVFGLGLTDVYITNAFPFVKAGPMSAPILAGDVRNAARRFLIRELQLVRPARVFALGAVASTALRECGISSTRLPHPAARIGGLDKHEATWRAALSIQPAEEKISPNRCNGWDAVQPTPSKRASCETLSPTKRPPQFATTTRIPEHMNSPLGTVVIYARDMKRTAAFYSEHFGFQTSGEVIEGLIELHATNGGAGILIHQAAKSVKLGQVGVKLSFHVHDVAAFVASAAQNGLKFGAIHEANGYHFANAKDPEKNSVSVSSRAFRSGVRTEA